MHFGIIAAGEGSRLAKEGIATPKPLLEIEGMPMIERLIRIFERCGAESINVVINGFMTEVREYLEALRLSDGSKINVRIKTTPSSMHTFYELMQMTGEGRFIATTVDTIFKERDFGRYVKAYAEASQSVDGMMSVTEFIDDEKPLYVDVDKEMDITAFADTAPANVKYISGGIYGLDGKAKPVIEKCLAEGRQRMRNFQRALLEEGLRLKAYPMGKIIDVDHPSDIATAERFLATN